MLLKCADLLLRTKKFFMLKNDFCIFECFNVIGWKVQVLSIHSDFLFLSFFFFLVIFC